MASSLAYLSCRFHVDVFAFARHTDQKQEWRIKHWCAFMDVHAALLRVPLHFVVSALPLAAPTDQHRHLGLASKAPCSFCSHCLCARYQSTTTSSLSSILRCMGFPHSHKHCASSGRHAAVFSHTDVSTMLRRLSGSLVGLAIFYTVRCTGRSCAGRGVAAAAVVECTVHPPCP